MIAHDYAKALFALEPTKATLANLRATLARRGHTKLLPQILREYQKLVLRAERLALHKKVTPEREQTRVLLELYKKLIASHA